MKLIYLGGNGYTLHRVKDFLKFAIQYCNTGRESGMLYAGNTRIFSSYIYVPLLENKYKDLSYEQLHPDNYSKYIYDFLPDKGDKYVFMGTSMGCYHLQNYASRYPETIEAMIWLEPTMCGGNYKLLKAYETGRGNKEWITELYDEKVDHEEWDSSTKVIDIAVSNDLDNDFDKSINLGIIYTTLNNEGKPYTPIQVKAKNEFLEELRMKGYHFQFALIKGPHILDLFPKYFQAICNLIEKTVMG